MTISTVSFTSINVGSSANDGTGDDLRTAFQKVNSNFGFMSNTGFVSANISVTNEVDAVTANISGTLIVKSASGPIGNSSATGTVGQITWDSGNVYICVATNTWKRATLSTY